jgi:hypothetical protein
MEIEIHSLLTSIFDGGTWSAHSIAVFLYGKSLLYPLNRTLSGLQSFSVLFGAEEKFLPLPRIETIFLGLPAHSLVTIPTALYQYIYLYISERVLKSSQG